MAQGPLPQLPQGAPNPQQILQVLAAPLLLPLMPLQAAQKQLAGAQK